MKNLLYSLIIVFLLFSCVDNKRTEIAKENLASGDSAQTEQKITLTEVSDTKEEPKIDTLTEAKFISLFKESRRNKYDMHADKSLKAHLRDSYGFTWTNKKLLVNDTLKRIEVYGFPLSFEEKKNKVKWLTTVTEGENHNQIRLVTLDAYYNMIDHVTITTYGGDAGTNDWSSGHFKNDSTFLMRTFVTGFDTDAVEDSSYSCLIIHSNGILERIENYR